MYNKDLHNKVFSDKAANGGMDVVADNATDASAVADAIGASTTATAIGASAAVAPDASAAANISTAAASPNISAAAAVSTAAEKRALNNKLEQATNLAQAGKKLTDDAIEKVNKVSFEIMEQVRLTLMMTFRFFDVALWHMNFEPQLLDASIATDAKRVYFNPLDVTFNYKQDPNICMRDYLHSILHCIFRQPLDDAHAHYDMWNLACDICIEAIAIEMAAETFPAPRDEEAKMQIDSMIKTWGTLTPHKLYKRLDEELAQRNDATDEKYKYLTELFRRDSHGFWKNSPKDGQDNEPGQRSDPTHSNQGEKREEQQNEACELGQQDSESQNQDGDESKTCSECNADSFSGGEDQNSSDPSDQNADEQQQQQQEQQQQEQMQQQDQQQQEDEESQQQQSDQNANSPQEASKQKSNKAHSANPQDNERDIAADALDDETLQEWEDISKQVETMLQEYKQSWGADFGTLCANLNVSNREDCDYTKFLKQFAIMGEDMMINDDEFDYIFYTYGLKLYENMPLVEPLEYKENKAVREFVIALDTSGSCQGGLIKEFVERTYEILRSTQGFGDKINLHIIQCDARVQSDIKITSLKEMEKFKDDFQIRGFGGTDFRPVFRHIDKMLEEEEFENLRGLIYFTDGMGTFPKVAPQYETAFIFVDSNGDSYHVPPWAMKVIIDEDEIFELGQE